MRKEGKGGIEMEDGLKKREKERKEKSEKTLKKHRNKERMGRRIDMRNRGEKREGINIKGMEGKNKGRVAKWASVRGERKRQEIHLVAPYKATHTPCPFSHLPSH